MQPNRSSAVEHRTNFKGRSLKLIGSEMAWSSTYDFLSSGSVCWVGKCTAFCSICFNLGKRVSRVGEKVSMWPQPSDEVIPLPSVTMSNLGATVYDHSKNSPHSGWSLQGRQFPPPRSCTPTPPFYPSFPFLSLFQYPAFPTSPLSMPLPPFPSMTHSADYKVWGAS